MCGDRVRCEVDRAHDEVLVVEVLPRRTLLARASLRGESEPVVANITQLVVVVAPLPAAGFLHRRPIPVRGHRRRHRGRGGRQQVRSLTLTRSTARRSARCAQAGYAHVAVLRDRRRGLDDAARPARERDQRAGRPVRCRQVASLVAATCCRRPRCRPSDPMREEWRPAHHHRLARLCALQGGGTLIDSPGVRFRAGDRSAGTPDSRISRSGAPVRSVPLFSNT